MRPARIGLIGARRRRQGLGPFVARGLREAGAEVPCFLATRPETVEPAATALDQHAGVRARGYVELSRMIESEDIDALAVLSPAPTHETYLRAATAAGLHALCEKPLIWGGDGLASRAAIAADEFAARGLLLQENCQWPYTLPAFRALHPDALDAPVERLAMRLSPTSSGIEMLGDALSHPLSLLQALIPEDGPSIERPRFERSTRGEGEAIRVEFDYRAGSCRVAVTVDLVQSREVPREAGLTINGGHCLPKAPRQLAYLLTRERIYWTRMVEGGKSGSFAVPGLFRQASRLQPRAREAGGFRSA